MDFEDSFSDGLSRRFGEMVCFCFLLIWLNCKTGHCKHPVNSTNKAIPLTSIFRAGLTGNAHIYSRAFFQFPEAFALGDSINRCGFIPMSSLFRVIHQELSRRTTVVVRKLFTGRNSGITMVGWEGGVRQSKQR